MYSYLLYLKISLPKLWFPTPTPETPSTQVTDTPKTGDDTHMLLWILLAVAGMAGVVSAVWIARKKK